MSLRKTIDTFLSTQDESEMLTSVVFNPTTYPLPKGLEDVWRCMDAEHEAPAPHATKCVGIEFTVLGRFPCEDGLICCDAHYEAWQAEFMAWPSRTLNHAPAKARQ